MARASAFQAEGRGFESRFPLQFCLAWGCLLPPIDVQPVMMITDSDRFGGAALRFKKQPAHVAQSVEHILGKDEVTSSILVVGSIEVRWLIMRNIITLACTDCKQRNYTTTKNKRTMQNRLEMKKYCKFCRSHKLHRETK